MLSAIRFHLIFVILGFSQSKQMELFLVRFDYFDRQPSELQFFTDLWNIPGFARDEASDRRIILIFEIGVKYSFDLVDLSRTEHIPISILALDDLDDLFLPGVLVLDLTDDLFENIFDSNKTGNAAILVDDNGYLDVIALHAFEQLRRRFSFGYKERVAYNIANWLVLFALGPGLQQVADIDHALDIVDSIAVNGNISFRSVLFLTIIRGRICLRTTVAARPTVSATINILPRLVV